MTWTSQVTWVTFLVGLDVTRISHAIMLFRKQRWHLVIE